MTLMDHTASMRIPGKTIHTADLNHPGWDNEVAWFRRKIPQERPFPPHVETSVMTLSENDTHGDKEKVAQRISPLQCNT